MTNPQQWIDDYFDGELSSEDEVLLRQWLDEDADHVRMFAKSAYLHRVLRQRLSGEHAIEELQDAAFPLGAAAAEQTAEVESDEQPVQTNPCDNPRTVSARVYCFFARPSSLSMTVSALVIGVLLTAMYFMMPPFYRAVTGGGDGDGRGPGGHAFVAQLTGIHEPVWTHANVVYRRGAPLPIGNQIALQSGFIEISYRNGVRVVLQGPCEYVVTGHNTGNLQQGNLVARIDNNKAHGFTVDTPLGSIIDLGTEFGVEVTRSQSRIEVFDGSVELRSSGSESRTTELLTAGQSAALVRTAAGEVEIQRRATRSSEQLAAMRRFLPDVDSGAPAHGLIQLRDPTAGGNRNDFTGMVGTQFAVGAQDLAIDALGFEDPQGDGLTAAHRVGIWNSSGELLASATIPKGNSGRLLGRWRYVAIDRQVQLRAGQTYILGAEVFSEVDAWTDAGVNEGDPGKLRLMPGLALAKPTNVFDPSPTFACPLSDGRRSVEGVRWAPANAILLGESNQLNP